MNSKALTPDERRMLLSLREAPLDRIAMRVEGHTSATAEKLIQLDLVASKMGEHWWYSLTSFGVQVADLLARQEAS